MHVDIQPFAEYAVAPYMGAWIETATAKTIKNNCKSHPTWVRGLKLKLIWVFLQNVMSHPTWVRGLKQMTDICPYYEAMSHPTWVRGLKLIQRQADYRCTSVAPYMGAWIETCHEG